MKEEKEVWGNDDVDFKNTVDRVLVNHFTETAGNINNNPSLTSDATTANNFNVKSPVYKKLKRCTYMDAKPVCKDKCNSCDCRILQPMNPLEKCCGEDCLNRQSFDECTPSTCSTGDKCTNRPMQKRLWKINSLSKFLTENMGYGVRTTEKLTSGQFIIEYCGEVVSEDEFRRRMTENYSKELHHYCLNLGGGFVIDGYRTGNISRNVNGIYRIGLFALTDISEGAELTYDYNFHSYNILSQQVCRCGAPNCRGVMGGKSQKLNKFIVGGIRNEISNGSYGKKGVKKKRAGYLKKPSLKVFPTSFLFSSGSVESIINKILPSDDKLIVQRNRLLLVRNLYKCIPKKLKRNAKNCTSSKYLNCKNDYNNRGHCWKSRNHKLNEHYGKFLSSLPGSYFI
ncbi:hypothetical protein HELRODRAFT_166943 [Helobdella robusta]|uniref:Histone-lysine N-methyltransferase n=1 Tax=Helobdella robusta TaxID=6412 RepID=T1EYS4_HELRO|nr:hypothetical protein HELRODRAFT_166943 [Helobdella robusta]ESO11866.1 hypothetical protein HELRODRAFT_166943 [Helobdella robusta]